MCLFPVLSNNPNIPEYTCGACPECLSSRSRAWAIRAVYESRLHEHNCMITLTYDNFARDASGRVIGELPPDRNLPLVKKHVQDFLKRLRKAIAPTKIRYIATGEHGKHTNRAHYHLIIFGYDFPDSVPYKKSKRGSFIRTSKQLTKLWGRGICTVDSIRINGKVASYCTKYCAKDSRGADDTFMLFSHGIGIEGMLKDFNGKSFIYDGREYPIPRLVWQRVISRRYPNAEISYRYVSKYKKMKNGDLALNSEYPYARYLLESYRVFRDNNILYQGYRKYWEQKISAFRQRRPSVVQRILMLDDKRYHSYKMQALVAYSFRCKGIPVPAPRVIQYAAHSRYVSRFLDHNVSYPLNPKKHLPIYSRYISANDTMLTDLLNFPLKRALKSVDKGFQLCYNLVSEVPVDGL